MKNEIYREKVLKDKIKSEKKTVRLFCVKENNKI